MDTLGDKLKRYRVGRDLQLNEVAAITGLSTSHISNVENGNCSISLKALEALAQCYKVPIAILISTTPDPLDEHLDRSEPISTYRRFAETEDYDMIMAAGNLSGAEDYLPRDLQ